MNDVKFALREVRKRKKMTQVTLAEKSGVNQQNISEYELEIKTPKLGTAAKLAAALGVTLDELVIIREAHDRVGEKFIKLSKKK